VGIGGMTYVYLAHDGLFDRDVALKLLKDQYAKNEELVGRFRREARSAASLFHPHIVPIFNRGETGDGTYYRVMEYLSGGTLWERINPRQREVHFARAGVERAGESGERPLLIGRRPLRDAHREGAVRNRNSGGRTRQARGRAATTPEGDESHGARGHGRPRHEASGNRR
jgi:hypothetical protein